ncbi:MAG: TrkA family potassium uptake protein [Bacillota bacterium]
MKQFAVIGLGRFGTSVAVNLAELGHQVLCVDKDVERVRAVRDKVTYAQAGNATEEDTLRSLGIRNFDAVIIGVGDLQDSILVTMLLKELTAPHVVVKAQNDIHGKILKRIGADRVVFPERDMGVRLAHNLAAKNVVEFIELSPAHIIMEVVANQKMVGKTLRQLDLRARFGANVLAIKRQRGLVVAPLADERIGANDILVVAGQRDGLRKLEES